MRNFLKKRSGFSIIELLVAITIVGILATSLSVNYAQTKARSRDANRKKSVDSYRIGIEQYRAIFGSYMVFQDKLNCVYPATVTDGATGGGCAGHKGLGWGAITFRGSGSPYPPESIADVWKNKGILSEVRTDPRRPNSFNSLVVTSQGYDDYILTVCDSQANQAANPDQAVEFAIFANLELPSSFEAGAAKRYCGGPNTGHGWDTLSSGGSTVQVLDYAVGSKTW